MTLLLSCHPIYKTRATENANAPISASPLKAASLVAPEVAPVEEAEPEEPVALEPPTTTLLVTVDAPPVDLIVLMV